MVLKNDQLTRKPGSQQDWNPISSSEGLANGTRLLSLSSFEGSALHMVITLFLGAFSAHMNALRYYYDLDVKCPS